MTARTRAMSLGFAGLMTFAGLAGGQDPGPAAAPGESPKAGASKADVTKADTSKADTSKADPKKVEPPKKPRSETATLGGGCFWCTEAVFERIPGVTSVVSGYSGGLVPNPTYQMVGTGQTGHAEVVQIEFDPDRVSFESLLKVFWTTHDPTTPNAQGPDFGTQYRSIILYHGDEQKKAAQKVYQELRARKVYRLPIVTELVPYVAFYPAEPYHQDYFRHHPYDDYSLAYIVPKVRKLKGHMPPPVKPAAPAAK